MLNRPTVTDLDVPTWLRIRWTLAWRENDLRVIYVFVQYIGRLFRGDLIWR